ncbi:MAG: AlpA family transcriptional regulator [Rhodospirillales bacterium]|nr:AlpA family transcriptional regulator [Rhodospirillales bacterium]
MKIIRIREVSDRTGQSKPTIYRRIAAGDFPKPVKLGPASVGWLECEIDDWIKARADARGGAA